MSGYENREGVRAKIEWEGGLMEALGYGLNAADMPEGDDELILAWDKLADAYKALQPLAAVVEKLLEPEDDDSARDTLDAQSLHDSPGSDL